MELVSSWKCWKTAAILRFRKNSPAQQLFRHPLKVLLFLTLCLACRGQLLHEVDRNFTRDMKIHGLRVICRKLPVCLRETDEK